MWKYHERTGSIITVNGSRRPLLTSGEMKDYNIGVTDPQLYTKMHSLMQNELVIAEAEKSASKERDSRSEPEVESDYDAVTLAKIAEMHGQHHHEELVQDPTADVSKTNDGDTVVDNTPDPILEDICGDKYKCSTEEEPVLKKGMMCSFFWGDNKGYLLGKSVAVISRSSKKHAFL